jgi:hypothetical protein
MARPKKEVIVTIAPRKLFMAAMARFDFDSRGNSI